MILAYSDLSTENFPKQNRYRKSKRKWKLAAVILRFTGSSKQYQCCTIRNRKKERKVQPLALG